MSSLPRVQIPNFNNISVATLKRGKLQAIAAMARLHSVLAEIDEVLAENQLYIQERKKTKLFNQGMARPEACHTSNLGSNSTSSRAVLGDVDQRENAQQEKNKQLRMHLEKFITNDSIGKRKESLGRFSCEQLLEALLSDAEHTASQMLINKHPSTSYDAPQQTRKIVEVRRRSDQRKSLSIQQNSSIEQKKHENNLARCDTRKDSSYLKNRHNNEKTKDNNQRSRSSEPKAKCSDPKTKSSEPKTKSSDPKTKCSDSKSKSSDPKPKCSDSKSKSSDPKPKSSDPKTKCIDPRRKMDVSNKGKNLETQNNESIKQKRDVEKKKSSQKRKSSDDGIDNNKAKRKLELKNKENIPANGMVAINNDIFKEIMCTKDIKQEPDTESILSARTRHLYEILSGN